MTSQSKLQTHLILPAGTQIVSRVEIKPPNGEQLIPRGSVGEVLKPPDDGTHSYRIRFINGIEAALQRHEMTIRRQFQREATQPETDAMADINLYDFVIYRCVVGSRAFGLDTEESDTDRRGIYLPPAELQSSLYGSKRPNEQISKT